MARFLFVVPPLVGHTNPTVSVAGELAARGHEVAWVGHPRVVRPLLPDGAAQQVEAAGAGIRLKFGRVRPDELRAAVARVLTEPSFQQSAARIQRSFAAAGGAPRAAALLSELVP